MTVRRLAFTVASALLLLAATLIAAVLVPVRTSGATPSELAELADDLIVPSPPPTPQPQPSPTAGPTPTPVPPPAFVQIPADLVATPTPDPAAPASLPALANIPSAPRDGSVVYLTFDDGPHPTYTNQILDLLAQHNAKATFYVLGNSVDAFPEIAARIVAEGHAIGNHTYYHEALPQQSSEAIRQTIAATNNAIARAAGVSPTCMRPPYGSLDQRSLQVVQAEGYSISMWEVDSQDWRRGDAYSIAADVLRDVRLGSRVLFHDGPSNRAATVQAVASVLQVLGERGVQFHALPSC